MHRPEGEGVGSSSVDVEAGRVAILDLASRGAFAEALKLTTEFAERAEARGRMYALFAQLIVTSAPRDAVAFFEQALAQHDVTPRCLLHAIAASEGSASMRMTVALFEKAPLHLLMPMIDAAGAQLTAFIKASCIQKPLVETLMARMHSFTGPAPEFCDFWMHVFEWCRRFGVDPNPVLDLMLEWGPRSESRLEGALVLATQCYEAGRLAEAEAAFIEYLECFLASPRTPRVAFLGPMKLDTANGREALADMLAAARVADVQAFPMCGTLLGLYRDGDLIAWDNDLDVGLLGTGASEIIRSTEFFQAHFVQSADLRRDRKPQWETTFRHRNGVTVDLFQHRLIDGRMLAGVDNVGQDWLWTWAPFQLAPRTLGGFEFLAPDDLDFYHAEHYGPDWRDPDPNYFFPHNLHPGSSDVMVCQALRRMARDLPEGRATRAAAMAQGVVAFRPSFAPMAERIARHAASASP